MKRGDLYRHKKGGLYVIVAIAERVEEEGGGEVVVYQNRESGRIWSQTVARFVEPGRFRAEEWAEAEYAQDGAGSVV